MKYKSRSQLLAAQFQRHFAEAIHLRLTRGLKWIPVDKTHLVLSDEGDIANGVATVISINRSALTDSGVEYNETRLDNITPERV